jgi:hypothetical protein
MRLIILPLFVSQFGKNRAFGDLQHSLEHGRH